MQASPSAANGSIASKPRLRIAASVVYRSSGPKRHVAHFNRHAGGSVRFKKWNPSRQIERCVGNFAIHIIVYAEGLEMVVMRLKGLG